MASFSVQAEDQSTLVNKTVNYILAGAAKQTVIKTSEITKLCLRGEKILLERILPQAINELENIYDMNVHTLKDDKFGRIILCTSAVSAAIPFEFTVFERSELRFLMIVLAYVFMKGGTVLDHVLLGFLEKLGIDEEPHDDFGYYKRLINDTFVRQMYLKKTTIPSDAELEDRIQYEWGTRATAEFDKKEILQFVADLFQKPVESFMKQYQIAFEEDDEQDDEEMET